MLTHLRDIFEINKGLSNDFWWSIMRLIMDHFIIDTIYHFLPFFLNFFDHFYWFLEFFTSRQAIFLFWTIFYQFLKLFTSHRTLQDLFWAILSWFLTVLLLSGLFQTYFGPFLSVFGIKSIKLSLNWSKISSKGLQGSTKDQN